MTEHRIGTAEREAALEALGDHFAQGRLTKEEYDERSDAVWSSRTAADLGPLFADLPHGSPVADPGAPHRGAPPWAGPAWRGPAPAAAGRGGPVPTSAADPRSRALQLWRGLPTPAQVVLGALLVVAVVAHLPLIIVAGVLWFVLSRHGVARPPWASHPPRHCGG